MIGPKPTNYSNVEIGDEVYLWGYTSIAQSGSSMWCKVTDVKTKYDEDTGEPYKVIYIGGGNGRKGDGYRADGGWAMNEKSMYFIEDLRKNKTNVDGQSNVNSQ